MYDGQPWGSVEELLTALVEQVDLSNRLYINAHGGRAGEPVKIKRPWQKKQQPLRGDELVAAFKGLVDDEENPVVVYTPPPLPAGGEN